MHGIIGNLPSAKFIFFANDDLTLEPDLNDIKRLLSTNRAFLFKNNGRHRRTINLIDYLITCKDIGLLNGDLETGLCVSYVVRVDSSCQRNELFELKYYGQIMTYLTLDQNKLTALEKLIKKISNTQKELSNTRTTCNCLERAIKSCFDLQIFDLTNSKREMEEINLQLNSYEEKKLSEIQDEINDWFYKAYWS